MTAREFSEVDHDLLADYVGGALDGTPEQGTVARLVAEDPAWGDAYAELARALDLVGADLADWAGDAEPRMPEVVLERITAALAGAGPAPDGPAPAADVRRAAPGSPVVPAQPTGGNRPVGGPLRPTDGPGHTGPGRRGRRWARIAAPVTVAAASIAAVGFGLSNLVGTGPGGAGSSAQDAGAPAAAPREAGPYLTAPTVTSGTDYTPQRLSTGATGATFAGPGGKDGSRPELAPEGGRVPALAGLDRLGRRETLGACLAAIAAEHGTGAVDVSLVDYASFQGSPALVVTFTDASGGRWAWVSGPECGVPGSGADTRFRTRVG
ncbi:hypothetical protein [Micromonospora auratinigra]|uniref:Uncharacterized protein n=1 Tax=Micromonospora auratinigra TaxID=261654 RepID=A0A1A9A0X1_9ACTN|nr:hypothetical protein [Micromonospora auratinigra]SBT49732.1 hypothetical protein GA0070611_4522 [Micromonospora auratinigra]